MPTIECQACPAEHGTGEPITRPYGCPSCQEEDGTIKPCLEPLTPEEIAQKERDRQVMRDAAPKACDAYLEAHGSLLPSDEPLTAEEQAQKEKEKARKKQRAASKKKRNKKRKGRKKAAQADTSVAKGPSRDAIERRENLKAADRENSKGSNVYDPANQTLYHPREVKRKMLRAGGTLSNNHGC